MRCHRAKRVRAAAIALFIAGASPARAGETDGLALCRDASLNATLDDAAHDRLEADRLTALLGRLEDPAAGCDGRAAFCVGQKLALESVDRAYVLLGAPTPDLPAVKTVLENGRTHGSPWQILVALGDVEAALAHEADPSLYRQAASALQRALNTINEVPLCGAFGEVRPDPTDIRRIRKRAQEAVLLSPQFDVARTRSGECGGIFLGTVRGIDVEATPVPITFPYGKATFTPEGEQAAEALLQCVKERNLPGITLTGHTDDHGSDAYNMQLAADRLAVVQAFFKAGGYEGTLRLLPKGKREPFQPDDPTQHTAAELDQMNRRVELRDAAP